MTMQIKGRPSHQTLTLDDVLTIINGKLISSHADLSAQVSRACGADLMSDVLAFTLEGTMLLTGLTNPQVVRTAEMAGVQAIVFVRGKVPPLETISLAEQKNIPLLATRYTMYESCGRLYGAGLPSCGLFDLASESWAETFGES
jgi:predicted transcriptional regulator